MKMRSVLRPAFGLLIGMIAFAGPARAHVTIAPGESSAGEMEEYTMRVPTERDTPTVRIEAQFPSGLADIEFEQKDGWTLETSDSAIAIRAVWRGGAIPPGEVEEFQFTARNPAGPATLVWRVIQVHEDDSRAEWIGPTGGSNPAPVVEIR